MHTSFCRTEENDPYDRPAAFELSRWRKAAAAYKKADTQSQSNGYLRI
jgi:hypothetical protein